MASNRGIAVISFDFSSILTWPNTNRWRAANAETIWIAALPPALSCERRDVLPSIAMTSAQVPVSEATHFTKHCRSEEHTSELQSLMRISYAVFCLKKKNHIYLIHNQSVITPNIPN